MNRAEQTQETNKKHGHQLFVMLSIWFSILCWGGAYVAARFLLHPTVPGFVSLSPLLLATLRFSIASLFFLFPLGRAIVLHQISARTLFLMALLGQLTFSLYYWLQYIGIEQTNASISSILGVGLIPLFTTSLAQAFGVERKSLRIFGALVLGFIGVAIIALQQPFRITLQSGFLLGTLCLVSNTFFFALYSLISKRWMQDISPIVLTGGTMVSGTFGLLLLCSLDSVHNKWSDIARLALPQWFALLFLALFCSVFAYFAYNLALSKRTASRVTFYFYFEPIVAILLGILLLNEHLTWQILVGGVTIIGAMILSNRTTP